MAAQLDGPDQARARRSRRAGWRRSRAPPRSRRSVPKPIARPYPIKPAGELYAEMLLATGDAAGAVRAVQAALARTPRRAASLLGLARAAQRPGRRADAAEGREGVPGRVAPRRQDRPSSPRHAARAGTLRAALRNSPSSTEGLATESWPAPWRASRHGRNWPSSPKGPQRPETCSRYGDSCSAGL